MLLILLSCAWLQAVPVEVTFAQTNVSEPWAGDTPCHPGPWTVSAEACPGPWSVSAVAPCLGDGPDGWEAEVMRAALGLEDEAWGTLRASCAGDEWTITRSRK